MIKYPEEIKMEGIEAQLRRVNVFYEGLRRAILNKLDLELQLLEVCADPNED